MYTRLFSIKLPPGHYLSTVAESTALATFVTLHAIHVISVARGKYRFQPLISHRGQQWERIYLDIALPVRPSTWLPYGGSLKTSGRWHGKDQKVKEPPHLVSEGLAYFPCSLASCELTPPAYDISGCLKAGNFHLCKGFSPPSNPECPSQGVCPSSLPDCLGALGTWPQLSEKITLRVTPAVTSRSRPVRPTAQIRPPHTNGSKHVEQWLPSGSLVQSHPLCVAQVSCSQAANPINKRNAWPLERTISSAQSTKHRSKQKTGQGMLC